MASQEVDAFFRAAHLYLFYRVKVGPASAGSRSRQRMGLRAMETPPKKIRQIRREVLARKLPCGITFYS